MKKILLLLLCFFLIGCNSQTEVIEEQKYYMMGGYGSSDFVIPDDEELEKTTYILLKEGNIYIGQYNSETKNMEEVKYGEYELICDNQLFVVAHNRYTYEGEINNYYIKKEMGNYTVFYLTEKYIKQLKK